MDFGMLPPEINSARMYSGPGPASLLAAAAAWNELAAELSSAAVSYSSVISGLAGGWKGPSSASMAAAAAPYVGWLQTTAAQAEQTAAQANAAASAYETAFAMTVPPPLIAANRAQLMALIATNVLGQNAPAIAATEAQYGEMWAQDAAAMYGYAGSAAAASTLTSFTQPPMTTSPAALPGQGGGVAQAASSSTTSPVSVVNSLNTLAMPLRNAAYLTSIPITTTNALSSLVKNLGTTSAAAASTVKSAGSALASGFASGAGVLGSAPALGGGAAVSAGIGKAVALGPLSVPQAWAAVPSAAGHSIAAFPGSGVSAAPAGGTTGVPPMMPIANMAARTTGGATPQYDMRPTVIPRSPSAG
ncbi:PPE family protein [Mycobacterium branderi]|uniref:PPE family protein n=1 Tax=Mycobacterium branderi TaxID=43348 RepID=A0A7I7WBM1_9MYCO|nr:PPE family protein [Mycobacterium branderi]MCV7232464.1 PPE domain-containing protein [Mycobacterium branderi]ORA40639.1 hypothetical protein BST20_00215 [Mycobacterium branderi]BBZ14490.1 PPE family protein [Mycobacterium branderi]